MPQLCQALALQILLWKIPPIMVVTHLHFWDQKFALFNFWLLRVYIEQIPNIFGCFPIDEPKYVLFSHIPSHLIIYYLGNCENFTENMEFLIVGKKEMAIYNFFNSVIDKLQLIIATKSINDNAE
ncbi:unnamed protein product [Rhizophagus irregularis]|nr:unnamed protein product [Rhizophagus irregularis]